MSVAGGKSPFGYMTEPSGADSSAEAQVSPGTGLKGERARGVAENGSHVDLCPEGRAATRWYLCRRHAEGLVFRAGSGKADSVANSCPVCGGLSAQFLGCACEYAAHPLDRSERPGRRILRRELPIEQV